MGWFGSDKQLLFTSENPKEQIRIMTPRVQLLAISWFAGRNTLIFLLSVLLWCLLITKQLFTQVSVNGVDMYRATKLPVKYPPCSERWASTSASAKSLWNKLKLARVREGCEVEINLNPKSWPLPSENVFRCNFQSIAV